jgi:hypothetical protein
MKPRSRTQIVAAVLGMHAVYSVNIPRSVGCCQVVEARACREVTIGRPKIRAVPVRPFVWRREIVHMCSRLWRLVRGRRHRVS